MTRPMRVLFVSHPIDNGSIEKFRWRERVRGRHANLAPVESSCMRATLLTMRFAGALLGVMFLAGCAGTPAALPARAVSSVTPAPKVVAVPSESEKAAWREAARYTNVGKEWLIWAVAADDAASRETLLDSARTSYLCAVREWTNALSMTAARTYETQFWLADAWNKVVRSEHILHKLGPSQHAAPTAADVESAIAAALVVRDSTASDQYVDLAAAFVIEESDVLRDLDYLAFDATNGARGVAKLTQVELEGSDDDKHVKVVPIPASVQRSIDARVAYVRRVPAAKDATNERGVRLAVIHEFDAGDTYFVYGHFAEARALFAPLYQQQCGKDEYAFRAWEKLISIAAKSKDVAEARRLAEQEAEHSCAIVEKHSVVP